LDLVICLTHALLNSLPVTEKGFSEPHQLPGLHIRHHLGSSCTTALRAHAQSSLVSTPTPFSPHACQRAHLGSSPPSKARRSQSHLSGCPMIHPLPPWLLALGSSSCPSAAAALFLPRPRPRPCPAQRPLTIPRPLKSYIPASL